MKIKATTRDAYRLLHDGTMVMADLEQNGLRVNVPYVERMIKKVGERIEHLESGLASDKVFRVWKKTYKDETNMGSRAQLAHVLFDVMEFESEETTGTGRHKADANALENVDIPFVSHYVELEKLKKARGTYLANILRETVNGIIHPNFNLHLVRTFRGSSDHPNFTNMPLRDELIKKIVRRAFIARKGHCLVDLDFKGSEVNAASWYHKDPVMLDYIKTDPGRMHKDAAAACYMLPLSEVTDEIRYCGKNKFVFPEFYGDWWLSCAKSLWFAIDRMNLKTVSGVPLKKWLANKGILHLGTGEPDDDDPEAFQTHIKKVAEDFWYEKFNVYREWKDQWYDDYVRRGWFRMLTGFTVSGYLKRNKVINYPAQGTAFHCLLWCLIEMARQIRKYKMKSLLVGQIHDDAVGDVPENELDDYVSMALEVITKLLHKHWPWVITPMTVDVEVTPVGGSWYDKEKKEYRL